MDSATMAFLSRFQWASIFGATSRQLPCIKSIEQESSSSFVEPDSKAARRQNYRDNSTQTCDESTPVFDNDGVDEAEHTSERSPDEDTDEVLDDRCRSENTFDDIDEQSLREERYVRIHDEVEEDYTAGPSRLVLATDGLKEDCPALLMTLELSACIQQTIYAEREFAKEKQLALDQHFQLENLEWKVRREIEAHEYRRRKTDSEDNTVETPVSTSSAKEVDNLHLMLENVKQRISTADVQRNTQAMILQECSEALNACLEESFIAAEIVHPAVLEPEIDVEPLDLQQEYQAFCEQLREMEEGSQASSVAALNVTGDTYLLVPPQVLTPEEQAQADLKSAFFDARERLQNASYDFDQRETARRDEQCRTDEDEETFDLRWLQHIRDLTREVIEAEEAFAAAKAAAKEAGLNLTLEYQSSGFADVEGDGDCMSFDDELIGTAHIAKIGDWLSGVDADMSSEIAGSAEVDDWEAKDVEICDSVSLVAYGPHRRKIDGWQQDCRRRNEE
ncbi:unnamed protein product [Zymoseptoria tritici ST99CH_1A5]|uniref:Uncharacterized protein n=1 Tax=Zymoseptoria tritici ST99CH_1A5 TaxID=1276529 RepID=A0A1Y6LHP8_ZYMTR|nr:unnamed protein product [Zymoseptoria tritici ST99CH_1A5]